MREQTIEIIEALVNANLKLEYIYSISFVKEYNLHMRKYERYLNIEVLKKSYYSTNRIQIALKHIYDKIKIVYLGEYTGYRGVPLNMWVKMSEDAKKQYTNKKSPCLGCPFQPAEKCDFTQCIGLIETISINEYNL